MSPTTPASPAGSSAGNIAVRLIICVDGARYNPRSECLPTNVYRIHESLKKGICQDATSSIEYNQVVRYVPAINAADDILSKDKLHAALPGQGYHQQIQEVYENCCILTGDRDEVVFFGFAAGAYVVRAVAGLLHHCGALASAGQPAFSRDFKKMKKEADSTLSLRRSSTMSVMSPTSVGDFRPPPKIRFVGVFDTVKAVYDDAAFDISFHSSIIHLRHALALHEDKKSLTPEYIYPEEFYHTRLSDAGRSEIQAWFIGTHQDMGGPSNKGGLGLYPLQWMLLEAGTCGISIDLDAKANNRGPLSIVFPKDKNGKDAAKSAFTVDNGVVVTMQDIQNVHDRPLYQGNYTVKLNTRQVSIRAKKPRKIFDSKTGYLIGYCDYAPQGTIIHPSVYLLLDEHINIALDTKEAKLQRNLEDWREKMLGTKNGVVNFGFWGDREDDDLLDLGAIRVLVCGNTGVGKSTLINKTFGVEVTQSSNRTRGIHNVKEEIRFEGRPDLILHDSGGFEAGADTEFRAIEEFLKERSAVPDLKERLHVIWFCIEINSARTLQIATEKLFQAVSAYANEVPIVVVATKKDDFLDIEFSKHRKELKKQKQPFDEEACEAYAESQLVDRLEQIRSEMESVPGGRLNALVAVSQDDDDSISELSKTTSHCFDTDKVRLLYIRAQVTRIDLKVDLALCEVMRRYKHLLRAATGLSYTVSGSMVYRHTAVNRACKAILNCFGLPSVSAEAAIAAMKANVWNHLGIDFSVAFAECMSLIGFAMSGLGGGIPVWLITGSLNIPLVVPSICRLFLNMSCDLILTLVRSFKEITFRESGQPTERDVQSAARIYRIRGYSQHVRQDIIKLVPKRNVAVCFKCETVRQTIEGLVSEYKDKLIDDVELPFKVKMSKHRAETDEDEISKHRAETDDDDDSSPISWASLLTELREANQKASNKLEAKVPTNELDSAEIFELAGSEKPLAEMDGSEKVARAGSSVRSIHELPG